MWNNRERSEGTVYIRHIYLTRLTFAELNRCFDRFDRLQWRKRDEK